MSYCVLDDLKKQVSEQVLVGLTDDESLEIKQEIVDSAIRDADAEINGYARTQYDVPFNPVPEIIRKLSVDISLYNLFSRRGFDKDKDANIVDRYKAAIRFLENLAKGVVTVGVTSGHPAPAPPQGVEIKSDTRIFSRDSMKGF
ncbi:MAG: gp436 family protein [Bacteroidota bacterium]